MNPSSPTPRSFGGLVGSLERWFQLQANGTTIRTEVLAGVTTFLTMAYIIFVQPAMLSGTMGGASTGLDFGAVMFATCVSSAIASLIMGLYAKYPICLAPGMGINAFFVFSLIPAVATTGAAEPWRIALGVVCVSGVFFMVLTFLGVRQRIMSSISPSLKNSIAVGIGIFIALIGLQKGGFVKEHAVTLVTMNHVVYSPDLVVFFVGFAFTAILYCRRFKGAILCGIVASTLLALLLHSVLPRDSKLVAESQLATMFQPASSIVALPPSPMPTLLQLDILGVFSTAILPFVIVFLFVDMFDTLGTLIGVAEQGGFMRNNRLPRGGRAMSADAAGTIVGSLLGTSTVTSYIESAAGVEAGGRTGLTCVVVAALFVLALFLSPVISMVGSYPPITAPALVLVGGMMLRNVSRIVWDDPTEAVPAFLIVVGVPLTFSIGDGMTLGFVAYPILKLATRRAREVSPTMYVVTALLLVYWIFVRASL